MIKHDSLTSYNSWVWVYFFFYQILSFWKLNKWKVFLKINKYMHKLSTIKKFSIQIETFPIKLKLFREKIYWGLTMDYFLNLTDNFALLYNITLCIFSYDFLFDLYWGQGGLRDQFWFLVKFRHVGVRLTFDVDQKLNVVMICEKIEHLWSLRCNIYEVQNITITKLKIYLRY